MRFSSRPATASYRFRVAAASAIRCIPSTRAIKVRPRSAVSSSQPTVSGVGRSGKEERWRSSPAGDREVRCMETGRSSMQIRRSLDRGRCSGGCGSRSQPPERPVRARRAQDGEGHDGRDRDPGQDQRLRLEPARRQRAPRPRRAAFGAQGARGHEHRLRQHRDRAAAAREERRQLLIAHASGYDTIAARIAQQYKVPIDHVRHPDACWSRATSSNITTSSQQGAYLAGILAAQMTKTHTLGDRHLGV